MTPAELRAEIARLGLRKGALAARWGVAPSTLRTWCQDDGRPPLWLPDALAGLVAQTKVIPPGVPSNSAALAS